MRKNLGKNMQFLPLPVLIIGTYDKDEIPNAMNAAWGGIYDYHQIYISLAKHKAGRHKRYAKNFASLMKKYPNVELVEILPYHKNGIYKWEALNIPYPLKNTPEPTKDSIKELSEILKNQLIVS